MFEDFNQPKNQTPNQPPEPVAPLPGQSINPEKETINQILSEPTPTGAPFSSEPPKTSKRKYIMIGIIIFCIIAVLIGGAVVALNYLTTKNQNANANQAVNANAILNANVVANANVVKNVNVIANLNKNANITITCEAENFQCDLISAKTHEKDINYVELSILGETNPIINTVAGQTAPIKIENEEVAQCIYGVELTKEGGKYINCSIKKEKYLVGKNAEITLPLTSGSESIKFTIPSVTVAVNANANFNANINANVNANINVNTNVNAATLDSDNDGLTDAKELLYGTDIDKADTDGDGFKDGAEIENFYSPVGSGSITLNNFKTFCQNDLKQTVDIPLSSVEITSACNSGAEVYDPILKLLIAKDTAGAQAKMNTLQTDIQNKCDGLFGKTGDKRLACELGLFAVIVDFGQTK